MYFPTKAPQGGSGGPILGTQRSLSRREVWSGACAREAGIAYLCPAELHKEREAIQVTNFTCAFETSTLLSGYQEKPVTSKRLPK